MGFFVGLISAILMGVVMGQKRDKEVNEVNCGRSCLLPCRNIAIKCVQDGVSPSKFTELMQCVIQRAQDVDYKTENPDHNVDQCLNCIEPQLEKLTVEEKAICLKEKRVDTCAGNEREQCNNLFFTQDCGYLGNQCRTMKPNGMNYATYRQVIGEIEDKTHCLKVGAKWRDGACKAKEDRKVKCGKINKTHQKDCRECQDLCWWLPGCYYKHKRNRCAGGPKPFATE